MHLTLTSRRLYTCSVALGAAIAYAGGDCLLAAGGIRSADSSHGGTGYNITDGGRSHARPTSDSPPTAGTPADVPLSVDGKAADMFCGPRCAQFVLGYYDHRDDLFDLIEEIQEPDWRRGSSFASVNRAIRRRGVHTAAIRINDAAILRWPEPVIVHLRAKTNDDMGHFVVQLPSDEPRQARFWCGLAGVQTIPVNSVAALRSGFVLLTSETEIHNPLSAVMSGTVAAPTKLFAGFVIAVALVLCLPSRIARFLHRQH